ncbi:MAG: hypothetical protein WBB67_02065 [bacterium]
MKESDLYKPIKAKLESLMKDVYGKYYLEITATRTFSNKLKEKIQGDRNIVFHFLRDAAPDITGFIKNDILSWMISDQKYVFVVVEIKSTKMRLDDIYQVRKYSELFGAKLTLLITTFEIPEEIKRLSKSVEQLLKQPDGEKIILAHYNHHNDEFKEWFPKDPFKDDLF